MQSACWGWMLVCLELVVIGGGCRREALQQASNGCVSVEQVGAFRAKGNCRLGLSQQALSGTQLAGEQEPHLKGEHAAPCHCWGGGTVLSHLQQPCRPV